MAGKPKEMSTVKQIYRLHASGKPKKFISRELGVSKNTVKRYLERLSHCPESVTDLLSTDDPVLEGKLFAGDPSYKQARYEALESKLSYYASELRKVGVTSVCTKSQK